MRPGITTAFLAGLFAMATVPASQAVLAAAPDYPRKPVRLVVPFAPGGNTDFLARSIAQKLTESLGQQVIVDNRPGAGGSIAGALAAKAPADGYTMMFVSISTSIAATLHEKLPFNVLRDFTPLVLIATAPQVLAAHPSVPATNVKSLIALARARPGKLTYASSGVGGGTHLTGELFKLSAGVDLVHVPYKGNAPALADLMGGQIDLLFAGIISVVGPYKSGRVRLLAVTSEQRTAVTPDIPTMIESGVDGVRSTSWYGLVMRTGTPPEIVQRLNQELNRILETQDVRDRLGAEGARAEGGTPEAFGNHMRTEVEKWAKVIKAAGIRTQ